MSVLRPVQAAHPKDATSRTHRLFYHVLPLLLFLNKADLLHKDEPVPRVALHHLLDMVFTTPSHLMR